MKQIKLKFIKGVTLFELLIVMTIIAVIAVIGYPTSLQLQRETRRADAHTMILHIHGIIQNFLTTNNTITIQTDDLPELFTLPITSKQGHYSVNVTVNSPGYTITATALSTSTQYKDTNCRQIIMDNNGNKSSRDANNILLTETTTPKTTCW